jgi:DNA-directed RNA polymerase subunit RPC12/RpoP
MIRFRCIYCGQKIRTADKNLGKEAKCPTCAHPIRIVKRPDIGVGKSEDKSRESKIKNKVYVNSLTDEQIAARYLNINPEETNDSMPVKLIKEVIIPKAYKDNEFQESKIPGWLKRAFVPTYNRLSLFLIGICMVMLVGFNSQLHSEISKFIVRTKLKSDIIFFIIANIKGLFFLLIFLLGMSICIYQIFTSRRRSDFQKWLMLYFAVSVNAMTGLVAGVHIIRETGFSLNYWTYIFPLWNILNGMVLVAFYNYGHVTPKDIVDNKVPLIQIIVSTLIAAVIFVICNYVFKMYWAITYSVCVVYATGFSRAVQQILCPVEKEL